MLRPLIGNQSDHLSSSSIRITLYILYNYVTVLSAQM
uniref:Uncharacterized protein n=1 Tax=Arundo donax TaxID=35708 RepID=A0A0A8Z182_ARUDO